MVALHLGSPLFTEGITNLMSVQPDDRYILHIASRSQWEHAQDQDEYRVETLESDGFIHCSRVQQVVPVADAWFGARRDLVLVLIDSSRLLAPLKYEGGTHEGATTELYPHLYGPLNREAVVDVYDFLPDEHGRFALPPEVIKRDER